MNRQQAAFLLKLRDGDVCFWCKTPFGKRKSMARTLDHIIPKSLGGTYELNNLVLAHQFCNSVRGDDDFVTARRIHKARPKRHRGGWASPAAKALRLVVLSQEVQ